MLGGRARGVNPPEVPDARRRRHPEVPGRRESMPRGPGLCPRPARSRAARHCLRAARSRWRCYGQAAAQRAGRRSPCRSAATLTMNATAAASVFRTGGAADGAVRLHDQSGARPALLPHALAGRTQHLRRDDKDHQDPPVMPDRQQIMHQESASHAERQSQQPLGVNSARTPPATKSWLAGGHQTDVDQVMAAKLHSALARTGQMLSLATDKDPAGDRPAALQPRLRTFQTCSEGNR
jgi:hypothetical protein